MLLKVFDELHSLSAFKKFLLLNVSHSSGVTELKFVLVNLRMIRVNVTF